MDNQMKEQLMLGATPVGLPEGGRSGLHYLGGGSKAGREAEERLKAARVKTERG